MKLGLYFLIFPRVWHDGLIFKLEQNGISGSMLTLLQNYLSNRKQRVVLNGSYSGIKSGVPQGSVLGPLLFPIYINDIERNIKSNVKFVADDTMLFSIVIDPELFDISLASNFSKSGGKTLSSVMISTFCSSSVRMRLS